MNKTHFKKKQALTNNRNRREFISGCAACAAGITILPSFGIHDVRCFHLTMNTEVNKILPYH